MKQLLPINNRPAVVQCLENIKDSHIADIVVVVNPQLKEAFTEFREFPAKVVVNELAESDMASSIRIGLNSIGSDATGIFVYLCDHPLVSSETLKAIGAEHTVKPEAIIIPVFQGRKGHPTLFPRFVLEEIKSNATLRDVIRLHDEKISFLDVYDEGVVLEMDTFEDYQKILERCEPRP